MKRVVITGPTGAIGTALIRELQKQGIEILAVCHVGSARKKELCGLPYVQVIECDLGNYTEIREKVSGEYDVFFHLAWDGTFGNIRNNTDGQVKNIEYTLEAVHTAAALGCKVFVGAGSQAEYGRVDGILHADTPTFPENGYGIAKLCAGQMSRILCEQLQMKHIWTRILSIYGPRDSKNTMIMSTIGALLHGEEPKLTKGEQQWDYLYASDAGRAMMLLGEKGESGKVYCIGSGKTRPLSEYIRVLRDAINPELSLGFGRIPYADKQVMHLCADISALQEDTGFSPEYSFEDGIRKTIDWYVAENENEQRKKD